MSEKKNIMDSIKTLENAIQKNVTRKNEGSRWIE